MSMNPECRAPVAADRGTLSGLAAGISAAATAIVGTLLAWQERSRQRHQLRGLSGHLLKDLGLDRADVSREASKPFWRQ